MANVALLLSDYESPVWREVIALYDGQVYGTPQEADVSIVLGGKRANPMAVKGKRILAYNKKEWIGWAYIYRPILEEYYDEFLDLSGLTAGQTVDKITEYVEHTTHKS